LIPRPDRPYTRFEHFLFDGFPSVMKLYRANIYLKFECRALAFSRLSGLMKPLVGLPFGRMLKRQVPEPVTQAKLIPDYPIGCKRILMSNTYLATMARSNVNLITDKIKSINEAGIETADGEQHDVDAIIFGTGFAATDFLAPMAITGRNGKELNQAWKHGAEAYLGMTVPNFPNFFMIYGPNTNLGHNSIIYMLESQMQHIMRCLTRMKQEKADLIEVDESEFRNFNHGIQQKLQHTVWSGCTSWYIDAEGHNSANWPGFTLRYRWLTRFSKLKAYRFSQINPRSAMDTTSPSPTTK
jgi:cation diffusion facilitator CzcD-associated flavoprotein CzcO